MKRPEPEARKYCRACGLSVRLENPRPWWWDGELVGTLGECPSCHSSLVVEADHHAGNA